MPAPQPFGAGEGAIRSEVHSRMADDVQYEHQTVKTIRGLEAKKVSELRSAGWELVEQTQGTLQTTLIFRRVKPATLLSKTVTAFRALDVKAQRLVVVAGGISVLLVAGVVGVVIANGGTDATKAKDPDEHAPVASSEPPETSNAAPEEAPASKDPEPAAPTKMTPANSKEFKTILGADYCDERIGTFATKHASQTIEFNGSVVNMTPHGDAKARFDLTFGPGDKGPESSIGPVFKYSDVNAFDLKFVDEAVPEYVREGDKYRFRATAGEYNADQCLFYVEPVSTRAR